MSKKKTFVSRNFWLKTLVPVAAALVLLIGAGWAGNIDFTGTKPEEVKGSKQFSSVSRSSYSSEEAAVSYDSAPLYAVSAGSGSAADNGLNAGASPKMAENTGERKLIRNVNLTIRTNQYPQDLASLQQLIADVGGYEEYHFENSDSSYGSARYVEMTVRIPTPQLDTFLGGIGGIGRLVSRSENVVDRTTEYYDNETRLNTLHTKMARLNELLLTAESVEDILAIEGEISDTQYEIDQLTGNQLGIDRQVDLSTVYISLTEEQPTEITPEMTLGEKLSRAFAASWEGFVEFLRNMLVFLVLALPAIVVIAVIVVAALLIRKGKKRSRADKADNEPSEQE